MAEKTKREIPSALKRTLDFGMIILQGCSYKLPRGEMFIPLKPLKTLQFTPLKIKKVRLTGCSHSQQGSQQLRLSLTLQESVCRIICVNLWSRCNMRETAKLNPQRLYSVTPLGLMVEFSCIGIKIRNNHRMERNNVR